MFSWKSYYISCYGPAGMKHYKVPEAVYNYVRQLENRIKYPSVFNTTRFEARYPNVVEREGAIHGKSNKNPDASDT